MRGVPNLVVASLPESHPFELHNYFARPLKLPVTKPRQVQVVQLLNHARLKKLKQQVQQL